MKRLALAALCLVLAGCGTTRVEYREVLVPTPVPCVADVGAPPAYVDTDEALMEQPGLFDRVKLLLAGREQRSARLTALEGQYAACRELPKASG